MILKILLLVFLKDLAARAVLAFLVVFLMLMSPSAEASVEPSRPVEQASLNVGILTRAHRFKLDGFDGSSGFGNDAASKDVNCWQVSLQTPIGPNFIDGTRPWSAIELSMPNSGSSRTSIPRSDAAVPLRYSSALNDYAAVVWMGKMLLFESLSIGLGYQFSFAAAANAQTELGSNPGGRMEISTGPEGSWVAGFSSRNTPHDFNLTYFQAHSAHLKQVVEANVNVNPDVVVTQPMTLSATTKWEPEKVVFNYRYWTSQSQSLGVWLAWENWRPYETPFLHVEIPGNTVNQVQPEMRNTVSPGINWDMRIRDHQFRVDFKLSPSPLTAEGASSAPNLLDTDTQILSFRYAYFLGTRSSIAFTTEWDQFNERVITKAQASPGAPGYRVGGYAFWLGTRLELAL